MPYEVLRLFRQRRADIFPYFFKPAVRVGGTIVSGKGFFIRELFFIALCISQVKIHPPRPKAQMRPHRERCEKIG